MDGQFSVIGAFTEKSRYDMEVFDAGFRNMANTPGFCELSQDVARLSRESTTIYGEQLQFSGLGQKRRLVPQIIKFSTEMDDQTGYFLSVALHQKILFH